jgi:hypothetical protein
MHSPVTTSRRPDLRLLTFLSFRDLTVYQAIVCLVADRMTPVQN